MKHQIILMLCLALALPSTSLAQRKKRKSAKKIKIEVPVENPKFTAMLPSTAKVTIIDSVVVDSLDYLESILTNKEEGTIHLYQDFYREGTGGIVYVNQLGNRRIYSKLNEATGHKILYQSFLLSNEWTIGDPLHGLDNNGMLTDFDYPYLMPDGVTLYFSAKGEESLGGYDIYRTRFDADAGRFLKPENIGLPFNSEQDDYMHVVDEQNQLGYFVSNRRQPKGKTCVYTFIPFESRVIVDASDEKLRSLARIDRIADTWTDRSLRNEAFNRKSAVLEQAFKNKIHFKKPKFKFVINDDVTYTSMTDFKYDENRENMEKLLDLQKQLTVLEASLNKARNYYTKASSLERQELNPEIIESESQIVTIHKTIRQLEKTIRNSENQ